VSNHHDRLFIFDQNVIFPSGILAKNPALVGGSAAAADTR